MTTTPITPTTPATTAPALLASAARCLEEQSFLASGTRKRALLLIVDCLRALVATLRRLENR